MSTLTPSIEQLSRIIGSVAAPAFLLGAVAAFISVLMSRMNRVIDRSQFVHSILDSDRAKYASPQAPGRVAQQIDSLCDHVRDRHGATDHRGVHERHV
jgi:hypothetical protein